MTIEGIIRMAKQAGFADEEIDTCQQILIHFAKLVAEHEREACVSIVDEAIDFWVKGGYPEGAEVREAMNIAEAIQARGQA
jgi:hypothetical protein